MPTIIVTKWAGKIDGSVKAKAMTFLQKLAADDTVPGLHIEPIHKAADPRVRTGRVDEFYRAVMFRLDGDGETHYVIHGVWPHDDAIAVASRVRLKVNPINGLPQIEELPTPAPESTPVAVEPTHEEPAQHEPVPVEPAPAAVQEPLFVRLGLSRADLTDRLGIPEDVADAALAAPDEDAILALAQPHQDSWLGMILVDLATGDSVDLIVERMELEAAESTGDEDADLLASLKRPGAQAQFAFIGDQEELRRVIEAGDFGAWRVFLHPEQRRYVGKTFSGPFRLSGGAGTGKTVVLVHRARFLIQSDPAARVVLTTFTKNLADALKESLAQLDPRIPFADALGQPGVFVSGIDSLAAAVIRAADGSLADAVHAVLGEARTEVAGRTPNARWRAVADAATTTLPPQLVNETFLAAEYATVVLPLRIRSAEEYLRVRRPGRGVALDRAKRLGVWELIEAYRAQNRIDGTLDYAEAAAVAAAYLEGRAATHRAFVDHVLVDEGQDLSPTHWQLLRALTAPGPDDLFIAEDSHQRIYGPRTVLSRYGIKVTGRSRRLTLNYRTTAQNLQYAMGVLEGGHYVDLEESPEATGYRSARSGPSPVFIDTPTLTDELDATAKAVRDWLESGAVPDTIAILVHDRFQRDRVVNGLGERGVQVRAVDRERPQGGRPVVMTMHRAKGTEFSKVLLAGVGAPTSFEESRLAEMDDAERADAELRARSLVYVAATRARDELVVLRRL